MQQLVDCCKYPEGNGDSQEGGQNGGMDFPSELKGIKFFLRYNSMTSTAIAQGAIRLRKLFRFTRRRPPLRPIPDHTFLTPKWKRIFAEKSTKERKTWKSNSFCEQEWIPNSDRRFRPNCFIYPSTFLSLRLAKPPKNSNFTENSHTGVGQHRTLKASGFDWDHSQDIPAGTNIV